MMRVKTMVMLGLVSTAVVGASLVAFWGLPAEHVEKPELAGALATVPTTPTADPEVLRSIQQQLEKLSGEIAEVRQLAKSAAMSHVRHLETRMSQVQTQLAALSAAPDPVLQGSEAGKPSVQPVQPVEPVSPASPEVLQARERQQTQGIIASLDTHLHGETYDSQWAPQTERDIAAVFTGATATAESTLHHLACQATLCRLEVSHMDSEAERIFMIHLGQLETFMNSEAFYERREQEDGSIATVVYAARQGHPLPQLANALQEDSP